MKICDTCRALSEIKEHAFEVIIGVETFHVCREHTEQVKDFILNRAGWKSASEIANEIPPEPVKRPRGRPRKYPRTDEQPSGTHQ